MAPPTAFRFCAVVLGLILFAAGVLLRAWHIASEPLWLDEAYSAFAADKGFAFLWQMVPRYETHPPFYYSLLRLWTLVFGDSLAALRALGLACGILAMPAAALAAREIGRYLGLEPSRRHLLVLAALALIALAPMPVEMSREVRPYPVMLLVMALQAACLFRLGQRAQAGAPLMSRAYLAYLTLLLLTLWLHNLGVLHAAAMGLGFLTLAVRRDWSRADWRAFLIGHAAVALLWAPAIWILADQSSMWMKDTWLRFSWAFFGRGLWALWAAPTVLGLLGAAALALIAALRLAILPHGSGARALAALLMLAAFPVAMAGLISSTLAPVFIPRTMTPVAIGAILLIALGTALAPRLLRLPALALLVLVLVQMANHGLAERRQGGRQYWYAAVDWLKPRIAPGDVVYAYPNEAILPFRYALRDRGLAVPTVAVPGEVPVLDGGPGAWHINGSRGVISLSQARLDAIADSPRTRAVPTIWLLRLAPHVYDKGDGFVRALERSRVQIGGYRNYPIELIGLRRISDRRGGPADAGAAR